VGPLPFHGVSSYPFAAGEAYPADAQHQHYLKEYDTRVVKRTSSPWRSLVCWPAGYSPSRHQPRESLSRTPTRKAPRPDHRWRGF